MASADAMNLEASRLLWSARVDPRHRRYAVGTYTHVLDQWGIIYDQPIVLGHRQAGAAIEGAVRRAADTELELLTVDTHGYTDFAMAISKLLGFDLCPRLSSLRDRQLHVECNLEVPKELEAIVKKDVTMETILRSWDELVRVVASIETGHTSARLALERYGSAARHDPVYRAGVHLGRLCRTLFLCDYLTNPRFRRELLRQLNHGEAIHALQRTLYFGGIAPLRGRSQDELVAISGSLALLANIIIAWVTHQLQETLDERRHEGHAQIDAEVLRHIAPMHFEGINIYGRYEFPIDRHAERLFATNLPNSARRR